MRNTSYTQIPETEISTLEQFIRGCILGDGSIAKLGNGAKNHRMTFGHCSKQLGYLKWKNQFLINLDLATSTITKVVAKSPRYKEGFCESFHFKSRSHPIFSRFRELYYKDSKHLNKEDISSMDEFALAIWYMDDGNIWRRKRRSDCISLNTQTFAKEDVIFLINLLYDKWNFISTYNKSDNTIRVSTKSCQDLLNIIEPYKVECMNYKWVLYKLGEFGEQPLVKEVNTEPS